MQPKKKKQSDQYAEDLQNSMPFQGINLPNNPQVLDNVIQANTQPPTQPTGAQMILSGVSPQDYINQQIQPNNQVNPVDLIKKYFPPDEWGNAIAVMRGESGGNPHAVGDNFPIDTGNGPEVIPSVGLFQIRTLPGRPDAQTLLDPETNVAYAAQLWQQNGGRWSPTWSAATKLGIK